MPSKRKRKLREDKRFNDDGWFPVSSDMWLEPGERPRKLRMISDANFPDELGQLIKRAGIDLRTARSLKLERLSDEDLLHQVVKRGCVLITMDKDFWSDEKFPLHHNAPIVFVDGKDEKIGQTDGFGMLMAFLKLFSSWTGAKFRVSSDRVFMKAISSKNKKCVYELRFFRPAGLYGREVFGFD